MPVVGAVAALAADPQLVAFTAFQRIRITPGNVPYGDSGIYGPPATDSYVVVPQIIDGTYSP